MSAPMDIPQRPPPRVAVEDVSEHGSPSLSRSPPEDPLADVRIRAALASASPSSFSAFLHPSSSSPSRSYSHSRSHSHSRTRPPESPAPFGSPLPAGGRPSDPADEGRGRRHRSGASALLTVVLTEAERKTEHLRVLLRIAEERADAAVHRAEAAEARAMRAEEAARRTETSLRRSEEAREDAEEAIGEAKRAKEECVKAEARAMALERDNRKLERENDRLERERSRAEAREKEALDASRRWQNQVEDEKAWGENMMKKRWEDGREVGFKQGYQDGRDAGYDEGREDTEAAYGRGVDTYDEPHARQGVPIVSLPSERHERIRAWAASADESMRSFSSPKPQPRPIWLRRRIQTEPQISGNYH